MDLGGQLLCHVCEHWKLIALFHRGDKRKRPLCTECFNKRRISPLRLMCNDCMQLKKRSDFYWSKGVKKSACKDCYKARRQKWYADNKDVIDKYTVMGVGSHPDAPSFIDITKPKPQITHRSGSCYFCGGSYPLFDVRTKFCSRRCKKSYHRHKHKLPIQYVLKEFNESKQHAADIQQTANVPVIIIESAREYESGVYVAPAVVDIW
jgi:hypothetical protein